MWLWEFGRSARDRGTGFAALPRPLQAPPSAKAARVVKRADSGVRLTRILPKVLAACMCGTRNDICCPRIYMQV